MFCLFLSVLSVILYYLLLTFVRWQHINKIRVTVTRYVTQNCCRNRCMFVYFYESALGSKELENDQQRSWRWRNQFLQERSLSSTKLVQVVISGWRGHRHACWSWTWQLQLGDRGNAHCRTSDIVQFKLWKLCMLIKTLRRLYLYVSGAGCAICIAAFSPYIELKRRVGAPPTLGCCHAMLRMSSLRVSDCMLLRLGCY